MTKPTSAQEGAKRPEAPYDHGLVEPACYSPPGSGAAYPIRGVVISYGVPALEIEGTEGQRYIVVLATALADGAIVKGYAG